MIILIPAYKPDESLVRLAQQIIELDAHAEILVVDDGSGSTYVHRVGVGTGASARSHCGNGGC